mgnify:CR=1 FL=1
MRLIQSSACISEHFKRQIINDVLNSFSYKMNQFAGEILKALFSHTPYCPSFIFSWSTFNLSTVSVSQYFPGKHLPVAFIFLTFILVKIFFIPLRLLHVHVCRILEISSDDQSYLVLGI